MQGIARFADNTLAEKNIDLKITVDDENDCPPVIKLEQVGSIEEASAAGISLGNWKHLLFSQKRRVELQHSAPICSFLGTVVMKVIATDADQENTPHSKISYKIDSESNKDGLFYINSQTGEVMVQQSSLDREVSHSTNLKFFFL